MMYIPISKKQREEIENATLIRVIPGTKENSRPRVVIDMDKDAIDKHVLAMTGGCAPIDNNSMVRESTKQIQGILDDAYLAGKNEERKENMDTLVYRAKEYGIKIPRIF